MKRRRLLQTLALSSLAGQVACRKSPQKNTDELLSWPYFAFHTEASIQFLPPAHFTKSDLQDLHERCQAIIDEAEQTFSLQKVDSLISTLNREGTLTPPPAPLLQALELATHLCELSNGLFDPTIQSYWTWLKEAQIDGSPPSAEEKKQALQKVDFSQVQFSKKAIKLPAGIQLTLNSLAQGLTTDLVYDELKSAGVQHALVNIGEYRALGSQPNSQPWRLGIGLGSRKTVSLSDAALATSSGQSHRLTASSADNHILNPQTGQSPKHSIHHYSVQAPTALVADGLATCATLMSAEAFQAMVTSHFPEVTAQAF